MPPAKAKSSKKKPGKKTPTFTAADKRNLEHVLRYLADVRRYFDEFSPDYKNLRVAVCNLDLQVFKNPPAGTPANRLCTGGGTDEPVDPPVKPVW